VYILTDESSVAQQIVQALQVNTTHRRQQHMKVLAMRIRSRRLRWFVCLERSNAAYWNVPPMRP
jgi:hypothetical protein